MLKIESNDELITSTIREMYRFVGNVQTMSVIVTIKFITS